MKKQFLAIGLLLSCVQVSKPNELAQYAPGLAAAAATAYGIRLAAQWGDDSNAPGLLKTIGRIPALKSRDTLTVLNAGGVLTTTALLFPATRDAAVMAGSAGLLYVIARRACGAQQSAKNSTNGDTVAAYMLGGAALTAVYKANALPPFTQFVNGILGRTATHGFYQL